MTHDFSEWLDRVLGEPEPIPEVPVVNERGEITHILKNVRVTTRFNTAALVGDALEVTELEI